jgi:hypothetical protein
MVEDPDGYKLEFASPTSRKRLCCRGLIANPQLKSATHNYSCGRWKSGLQSNERKVFTSFYVALNSVQKKRQSCVIPLTEMGRQEAETVVKSCAVTLYR